MAPIAMRAKGGRPHNSWAGDCSPKTPEINTSVPPEAKTTDAMTRAQNRAIRDFGAKLSA